MTTEAPSRIVPEWDFADRLRKARLIHAHRSGRRITQAEFAAMLNVPAPRYTQWESGNNLPDELVGVANAIEDITAIPAEWMLLGRYDGQALKVSRELEIPGQGLFSGADMAALLDAVTPPEQAIA